MIFGKRRVLVVKRLDRRWTADGRLLRLPQEDCCQALSISPVRPTGCRRLPRLLTHPAGQNRLRPRRPHPRGKYVPARISSRIPAGFVPRPHRQEVHSGVPGISSLPRTRSGRSYLLHHRPGGEHVSAAQWNRRGAALSQGHFIPTHRDQSVPR
jgi:hypothetical protein